MSQPLPEVHAYQSKPAKHGQTSPIALMGFRPGPGGIPRVMLDLIDGFQTLGVPVDLLLPDGNYPDLARLSTDVPQSFPLNTGDSRVSQREIQTYLNLRRPAAILSNKEHTNALLADVRASGMALPPVWLRIASDVRENIRRKQLWRRHSYRRGLNRQFLFADGLIANSAGVAESLASLLPDADNRRPPIHVIANPLNLERIKTLGQESAPHPWLDDNSIPVIVGMGRLVTVKDFPKLIRAFARLRSRQDARLIIFGEGRKRKSLERLIHLLGLSGTVSLPGFTDNPFAALSRAALFVLSSRYEGSPNVLIESLACGTPCVSTDCRSGPRDILDQGHLGPLTPTGDIEALANAMLQTLHSPPPPDTLIAAAQRYDHTNTVTAYLNALGIQPWSQSESHS